jgi:hypothetical protein
MKEPKIYKSIWQVVVLSGEPVSESMGFEEMAYRIDEGDCLGSCSIVGQQEIEGAEAIIRACEEVGNDGSFFMFRLDGEEDDGSAARQEEG